MYKWQNDYMSGGIFKDGLYYVKLDLPSSVIPEFETLLPPTRCIEISGGRWNGWYVSLDLIESPAFTIGKEYEFSGDGVKWRRSPYLGFIYGMGGTAHVNIHGAYKYCREIKEEVLKITIDGKEQILNEDKIKTITRIIRRA